MRWPEEGGRSRAELPGDWGQGRATFGGLVCGAALHAMARRAPADRQARSFDATFVGPVVPGPAEIAVEVLGEGRSASHLEARLLQGGVRLAARATFGLARPSSLRLDAPSAPELPAPEALPTLPYVEGVTPAFTRFLEYRFAGDGFPFTGRARPGFSGWVRLPGATGAVDAPLVLALLDAWPPAAVAMLTKPAPASSATLSALLTLPDAPPPADGWFAFRSTARFIGDGWSDLQATLWTADGHQLGTMTQLSAIFG